MSSERLPVATYRETLGLLAAAWALLAAGWVLTGDAAVAVRTGGVLLACLAALHARSAALVASASLAVVFLGVEASGAPALGYRGLLALEALAAALPVLVVATARLGTHLARRRAGLARPVPLVAIALFLAASGTAVRWGEIALLWDAPGTVATVRYTLRADLAETAWGLAAAATAAAYLYGRLAYGGRGGAKRAATAAVLAVLVFSFVGYDVGTALAAAAHGPVELAIGLHTADVRTLPSNVRLAHVDVAWDRVEREPGVRDWSFYDEQVRHAESRGLSLLLLANTYPPRWLADLRPESVMIDQDGAPFTWIDERPGQRRERLWDLSFHDDLVLRFKEDFTRAVAARYGGSAAVRWISVQNEPAYPVDWNLVRYASYDNVTVEAFRSDLVLRYGTLEALRANTSVEAASWSDVEAPRHPFAPLWDDWMRFREDGLVGMVDRLVAAVRAETEKPVTVKIMAHFLTRFAAPQAGLSDRVVRAFANVSDVVSVDLYPSGPGDLLRSLDYYADVAGGKPLLVAEFNLLLGPNLPTSGARLANALLAMDGRVEAVFLFTADDHWLYGLSAHDRTPALAALALVGRSPIDPAYHAGVASLLVEDTLAVANVYDAYVLGMAAAGLPALPWPVLLLVGTPVPSPDDRTRLRVGLGKALVLAAAFALLVL